MQFIKKAGRVLGKSWRGFHPPNPPVPYADHELNWGQHSAVKEVNVPELDLTGWAKILDWGYDAELYGRGSDRVMVDRETGRVIIRYTFREETGKEVILFEEDRLKIQPKKNKGG